MLIAVAGIHNNLPITAPSMSYGITASGTLLLVNSLLAGALALYTWKRRKMHGALYLFLLMLSVVEWSFTAAFEDMAYDYYAKILWSKFSYIGITSAAPLWFLFTLYYRYEDKVKRRWIALISIVPAFILAAAFTNELHRLVWPTITWGPPEIGHRLIYAHGPLKWTMALYSYILLLSGTVMLIRTISSSHKLFRWQFLAIITAALAPWAGNVTYLTGITPAWIDTTPLFFTVTGILISWGLTRFHLLDIAPIAYDTLFMNMTDGVLVLDSGNRIVNINPAAKAFLHSGEDWVGRHIREIPSVTHEISGQFRDIPEGRIELKLHDKQEAQWIDVRISPVMNRLGERKGRLFVIRDITERKRLDEELTRYATTDTLTGVFNRRMGLAILEKELSLMQRLGAPLSVCFADINNLKDVNDRLGHEEGDRLITGSVEALRSTIRDLDSVARLGGDEFLLVLPQCTALQASLVISRADAFLAEINAREEKPYAISLSYGIAEYHSGSGESADELVARADQAMYEDKRHRKGIDC